ncbi:MAG: hypothetical protein NZ580_03555 [Bacteroidia bacterium]|nr:hypothetical protein [Bacteroidia bacterium]MDW8235124.1 hypothetical protein [Bacteroidia bacterium]
MDSLNVLFSVYHKESVLPLARRFHETGALLWATAGTAHFLRAQGLPAHSIEELTGFSDLLGGRVKTLHPSIFAGILARPEDELPINQPRWQAVVVELYPFQREAPQWVELIDIGGVSLLRAAAKNYAAVWAIPGPDYYEAALEDIEKYCGVPPVEVRFQYAAHTFAFCAAYDSRIAQGFLQKPLSAWSLRYGENPHQKAFFLGEMPQLHSTHKELSYNNLLDLHVGWRIVRDWAKPACVILKHTQPCGAAYADTPEQAYQWAHEADPEAAYGGVVVCNFSIEVSWLERTKGHFIDVLYAPAFSGEAIAWLRRYKPATLSVQGQGFREMPWEVRSACGGLLWQESHSSEEPDMQLRWAERLLRSLYSNAIVILEEGRLIAAASGQTSRIEAVRLAIARAQKRGFQPQTALLASDGFFPFRDSLELTHAVGISRVAVPPGGKRQNELEEFARTHDICMTYFMHRHFRH